MYDIDQRSSVPVYEQLVRQIQRSILSGDLSDGDKLPSIRELASALRINPNTVAKSYRQLENDGLVNSKRGLGIFVTTTGIDLNASRNDVFQQLTGEYLRKSQALGLDGDSILQEVVRLLKEVRNNDFS